MCKVEAALDIQTQQYVDRALSFTMSDYILSQYAHMVEENNLEHETLLEEVRHAEVIYPNGSVIAVDLYFFQGLMRNFCETLPEDRILHGNGADMDSILEKEVGKRTYRIQNTGATLTYHSSLAILSRYANSLVKTFSPSFFLCNKC